MTAWLLPLPRAASSPSHLQRWSQKYSLIISCKLKSIWVGFLGKPILNSPWWLFWVTELTMNHIYFRNLAIITWFELWWLGTDHTVLYLFAYPSVFLTRLWCLQNCSLCFITHCVSFQVHNSKWNLMDTHYVFVKWIKPTPILIPDSHDYVLVQWAISVDLCFIHGYLSKSCFFRKFTKQTENDHMSYLIFPTGTLVLNWKLAYRCLEKNSTAGTR